MIHIRLSTDGCCVCEEHVSRLLMPAVTDKRGTLQRRVHTALGIKKRLFLAVRDQNGREWLADSMTGTLYDSDGKSSDPQLYLLRG